MSAGPRILLEAADRQLKAADYELIAAQCQLESADRELEAAKRELEAATRLLNAFSCRQVAAGSQVLAGAISSPQANSNQPSNSKQIHDSSSSESTMTEPRVTRLQADVRQLQVDVHRHNQRMEWLAVYAFTYEDTTCSELGQYAADQQQDEQLSDEQAASIPITGQSRVRLP